MAFAGSRGGASSGRGRVPMASQGRGRGAEGVAGAGQVGSGACPRRGGAGGRAHATGAPPPGHPVGWCVGVKDRQTQLRLRELWRFPPAFPALRAAAAAHTPRPGGAARRSGGESGRAGSGAAAGPLGADPPPRQGEAPWSVHPCRPPSPRRDPLACTLAPSRCERSFPVLGVWGSPQSHLRRGRPPGPAPLPPGPAWSPWRPQCPSAAPASSGNRGRGPRSPPGRSGASFPPPQPPPPQRSGDGGGEAGLQLPFVPAWGDRDPGRGPAGLAGVGSGLCRETLA